jgi:MFS family permease
MQTATRTAAATRARWAITAVFGFNGVLIASLVVRMPSLKLDLGLTAAQLGLVSAIFGASAVVAMHRAGRVSSRVGSRPVVRLVILLLPLALVGLGLAPGIWQLIALQTLFGAAQGTLDVTMNAHAVAVERKLRRPVINGCHAAWSIGAILGSLLGSGAAQVGMARSLHYMLLATLLVPAALIEGRSLLPAHVDRRAAAGQAQSPRAVRRVGWTRRLMVYGAMGATVLAAEAAVANWSGVFLHERLGAPLGMAALGYLAFAGCQAVGRLAGDRLSTRGSSVRLLRMGTLLAAVGMAVVVLSPWPALGIVGFAVLGVGLAAPLPVLFAVVGHLGADHSDGEHHSAVMVARFGTLAFTGLLLAPAVMGWLAEMVGLTWTLAALIPMLVSVAAAAGTTIRPDAAASAPVRRQPAMMAAAR